MKADIRQQITEKIITSLAAGCPPWRRPWSLDGDGGLPANIISRRPYSGVNTLLLSSLAMERGYSSRYWGTYQQWSSLGGQVRRRPEDVPPGEWGCRIIYCKEVRKSKVTEDGEESEKYKLIRAYTVFSLDQVDGGPAIDRLRHRPRPQTAVMDFEPAERAIRATGADIRYGGTKAFYSRTGDFIQMPQRETFPHAHDFYATTFHELAHWTERRVGWTGSYGMGELIAEMAACFVCSELAIPQSENLENHAAYLNHWLRELQADSTLILKVAAAASRSSDFILDGCRTEEPVPNVIIV
jgi:antirestriction protein ArdC